jgi:Oxidoreductase family, NAD-binding Rossmann fold
VLVSVHRVLILGARRRKQGLGEFIAKYFHEQGAEVCGIVGTSSSSVEDTARHLQQHYGISTQGYTDLKSAIEQSSPTVVVIASPTGVHHPHLETVAASGVYCLCEKPLFWDDDRPVDPSEVERLVDQFCGEGQLLQLVTQWPETLEEYYSLYPEVQGQPVERLEMLLGPASSGINMVIDSLPHVLSMVHCLTGIGEVQNPRSVTKNPEHLTVLFEYRHATGCLEVAVDLVQTPESPRPAGYAINGHAVRRSIQLPEYQMIFTGESGKQVAVADPLEKRVRNYLADLEGGKPTDRKQLIASMIDLKTLVENLQI